MLSLYNLKLWKRYAVLNIYIQEKFILRLTSNPGLALTGFRTTRPWGPFLESPGNFSGPKAIAKSRTLRLQSCFIPIFLIWREVPFIQEVSGVYTSPFLDKSFRGCQETGPWRQSSGRPVVSIMFSFKNAVLPRKFENIFTINNQIHCYNTKYANSFRLPII